MAVAYFNFAPSGRWRIVSAKSVIGPAFPVAAALDISDRPAEGASILRGFASNVRYATRGELTDLRAVQEGLGRPQARRAALIPIKKSEAWWELAQDERRRIFEEQSRHHTVGIRYLPQIARKLYHCRDLDEPFDFLTWFEFAPEFETMFDRLLVELRESREWTYVSREFDIRLERAEGRA